MRTIVTGVFLGMWLFAASVVLVALLLGRTTLESLRGPSTSSSTLPPVPVPGSTP